MEYTDFDNFMTKKLGGKYSIAQESSSREKVSSWLENNTKGEPSKNKTVQEGNKSKKAKMLTYGEKLLEASKKKKGNNTASVEYSLNMYKCDECDYEVGVRGALDEHKQEIHKPQNIASVEKSMKMYLCDKSDYEVSGKEELKSHKERDHKRAVI